MSRVNKFKVILWIIVGIAAEVEITRFIYGLGVTTNLTDNTPWGFWIGFDVMGGVALAAGGFVIAAINYIFGRKRFHPISRAAILTAFLGYIAVVLGLLFDLGLPWNIWHMVIFWNPHSPLFEVGWCVMLYLTVLFLEFAPVVLERWPKIKWAKKIYDALYKLRIPLVILGIMLSTLHQSSLGSLFLAMPYKLHPLWYSPMLPVIFFISAVCLGMMMVMVESMTSSWLYKREPERDILNVLKKYAIWAIIFYAVVKFGDVIIRGAAPLMFEGSWAAFLFWFEIAVSIGFPLLVFALPALARNINWLYAASLAGVFGIVLNRLNVGGITHLNNLTGTGAFYIPSWMELSVSAGVVSVAMLVFFYFVENYKVWEEKPVDPTLDPKVKPEFGANRVYLGSTKAANRTKFSFAFVIAFAIGFAVISGEDIESKGLVDVPVSPARGADTLFIDGNRDGYGVYFKHTLHSKASDSAAAFVENCATCHHMNKPADKNTSCFECHFNMYTAGDAFRHDWHASKMGANLRCFDCHAKDQHKSAESAADCDKCHTDLIPKDATIEINEYETVPYVDAMHMQCIGCHETVQKADPELMAREIKLTDCRNCHPEGQEYRYTKRLFDRPERNKWVVIPNRFKKPD